MKYIIFSIVVVFNFMLEHFELVKCPLCSSFCCVLLIFLYGIKGCFLSKIYSLNILLNQHPTRLSFTPYTATTTARTILISLKTQRIYCIILDTFYQKVSTKEKLMIMEMQALFKHSPGLYKPALLATAGIHARVQTRDAHFLPISELLPQ